MGAFAAAGVVVFRRQQRLCRSSGNHGRSGESAEKPLLGSDSDSDGGGNGNGDEADAAMVPTYEYMRPGQKKDRRGGGTRRIDGHSSDSASTDSSEPREKYGGRSWDSQSGSDRGSSGSDRGSSGSGSNSGRSSSSEQSGCTGPTLEEVVQVNKAQAQRIADLQREQAEQALRHLVGGAGRHARAQDSQAGGVQAQGHALLEEVQALFPDSRVVVAGGNLQ